MTDLSPNDLSHLSDEEFNALCPQGYHATGPAEPLSHAAQAVLNAFLEEWDVYAVDKARYALAAALRAASRFVSAIEVEAGDELLAIAAELEGKCNG